ncbi:CU044_5270 family protein [Phytomonospora sp. NPDC050363]|uniref:CU044_5270 family protein n=1 Tax=Phytomonospora sp. NPDC050363 TaxID=3155642 RepID=UPI0033D7C9D8
MTEHDNDDLRLVASFREELDEQTPRRLASVRATFLAEKNPKGRTMNARKTSFFTPRRIAVVALPAVAAIALGAVALGSVGNDERGTTPSETPGQVAFDLDTATAPEILRYAAYNTGRSTHAENSTGDYVYVRETSYIGDDAEPNVREAWHEIDLGMHLVMLVEDGVQTIPDASNPKEDLAAERAETADYLAEHGPTINTPTRDYLASLPTDAEGMLAVLRAEHPDAEPHSLFKDGVSLLITAAAVISPDQRTAVFEAMATLDNVTRTEGTVEVLDRTGVAVGFDSEEGSRYEIIIDPETSDVLGTRYRAPGESAFSVQAQTTTVVEAPGDTE